MEANEIKKLSTSHSCSIEKSWDDPPCKHFSIRGYVAKMGQKDRKTRSPFIVNESDAQPSLPPLVVARFNSWSCNICRRQNGFNVIDKCDKRNSGNGIQESSMSDRILGRRDIDLNIPVDLTKVDGDNGNNDNSNHDSNSLFRQINNEKKNDEEVAIDRITDDDLGLENNLNHQVSNAQSLEMCLIPIQETRTNEKGFEGNVASNMGIVNGNLKTKYKSSSEVLNEENYIFKYNQCIEEFRKSCTGTKEVVVVDEKDSVPLKPLAEDSVPAREMNNNVENDVQEHHQKKYIHKSSKKRQKMRLLKELYTVETGDTVEGKRKMLHENQEGQHLSINNSSQEENRLTFPWPIQEGTSNYQLISKEGEINYFGERRFPSTNALSRKGKRVLIDEIDESTEEDTGAKDNELHGMKSYIDLTAEDEESDQDTLMEIAEIMANSLPDVDNLNRNQKN